MENKTRKKFWILLIAIFMAQLYLASALTISSVNTSPNEVQPGEKFSLNLKIENNLEDNVENVVVSLILNDKTNPVPFSPYQSSNEVRIDEIQSDDNEKASFDLIVFSDAVSGTYNIPVTVSYNNGTPILNEPLGLVSVIINAQPKIDISSEESFLIKGTNEKISIKIVNSGLGNSKFLTINLNQISGLEVTSTNSVYIGNIDSNDFDTADFNVFVNTNAPSTINLPVKLTYTDSQNNQVTESKIISIKTYTAKEAMSLGLVQGNNTFLIIASIAGALILFLIYRRIRKKNRNKRNGQ